MRDSKIETNEQVKKEREEKIVTLSRELDVLGLSGSKSSPAGGGRKRREKTSEPKLKSESVICP